MKRYLESAAIPNECTMKIKTPSKGKFTTTITFLRAEKSKDQYRYTPGGRERRRTRAVPSLPKLSFVDAPSQRSD